LMETNTGLGRKAGIRFIKPMAPENRQEYNTYIWQSRFQTYIDQMRWRTLHTNKKGNTPKGNNNYQPTCNNVSAPNFIRYTLKNLKAHIDFNTVVVGDFNCLYHQQIDHLNKKSIKKV
jgi:hypothetical protein